MSLSDMSDEQRESFDKQTEEALNQGKVPPSCDDKHLTSCQMSEIANHIIDMIYNYDITLAEFRIICLLVPSHMEDFLCRKQTLEEIEEKE